MVYRNISIHPPRAGRDRFAAGLFLWSHRFQSTRPVRGGTSGLAALQSLFGFQSTRPVRGGTFRFLLYSQMMRFQSTRPVRGGTFVFQMTNQQIRIFQSTRPVRGGTAAMYRASSHVGAFQSTRPVRGGTGAYGLFMETCGISIHPPRAGRDVIVINKGDLIMISIHPPRAGRDTSWYLINSSRPQFQSTRPVRGGTGTELTKRAAIFHFNPPAPCGAGHTC